MKKLPVLPLLLLLTLLSACGGKEKKVIIMASGKLMIDDMTISIDPGTTHNEKELIVKGDKITLKNGTTVADIMVTEPGLYVLNMKMDTLVGSYQRVGTENTTQRLTQEDLQKKIDSLEQLTAGTNVSAAARNFNISPGRIARITGNTAATVIGPYLKMPSSFEGGKEYEIYKFSTNKEIRETIDKLRKFQ